MYRDPVLQIRYCCSREIEKILVQYPFDKDTFVIGHTGKVSGV